MFNYNTESVFHRIQELFGLCGCGAVASLTYDYDTVYKGDGGMMVQVEDRFRTQTTCNVVERVGR